VKRDSDGEGAGSSVNGGILAELSDTLVGEASGKDMHVWARIRSGPQPRQGKEQGPALWVTERGSSAVAAMARRCSSGREAVRLGPRAAPSWAGALGLAHED
jgi:hypothetical protein